MRSHSLFLLFLFYFLFFSGGSLTPLDGSDAGLKENLDLPFDAVGAEDGGDAPETIKFYGAAYEGASFFFIVDTSASMNETDGDSVTRLERLKSEVRRAIFGLEPESRFSITSFAGGVWHWHTGLVRANQENKASAVEWVNNLAAEERYTYPAAAFSDVLPRAREEARRDPRRKPAILFVSDGLPNLPRPQKEAPAFTLAKVTEANGGAAVIHAIWVGAQESQAIEFMQAVATANGGLFHNVAAR